MFLQGLRRWLVVQAVVWVPVLLALSWSLSVDGRSGWQFAVWGGLATGSYVALLAVLRAGRRLADVVTVLRFAGMLAVGFCAWREGTVGWGLWFASVAVVAADLLDGFCARRFGASEAGAVLDMETDQLVTVALALLLHAVAGVSAWVLLLPGFRYLYVLCCMPFGIPVHDPKPRDGDNRQAKYLCAAVMVLMLFALLPGLPDVLRAGACQLSIALFAWSYATDIVFLARRTS